LADRDPTPADPGDLSDPAGPVDLGRDDSSAGAQWGRRRFLSGLAAGAAGLAAADRWGWSSSGSRLSTPRLIGNAPLVAGQLAVPMAMHVHASFSEGDASLAAHLSEAVRNRIPIVGFSDHDWRMSQIGYRQALHFDSLSAETEGLNPAWVLQPTRVGALTADAVGEIVADPVSPVDPSPLGSLHVRATSAASAPASYRLLANAELARTNQRANIVGQSWDLEVLPTRISSDSWLELLVTLSYRPATSGRPADRYQISYRFGIGPPGRLTQGVLGIVAVPVTAGQWNSVHLDPLADIQALWPDVIAEDNATYDFSWGATSQNAVTAEGYFDYHRFNRDPNALAGDVPLQLQQELLRRYQSRFPAVAVMPAVEYSYYQNHVSGFGPNQHLPVVPDSYTVFPSPDPGFPRVISNRVLADGGVASYNHPFGTADGKVWATDKQDATRRTVAATMLDSRANDANLLEVGYAQRGHVSLAQHLSLWDTMWRNGLWITGTGVTDDHSGHAKSWTSGVNRYITTVWAPTAGVGDLLAALRAGRAFCSDLPKFKGGALDLTVDGAVPMGSVSVRPDLDQRQLTIMAVGLPTGGSVQVVRGPVDYAGSSYPDPGTQVVTTVPAADFATGSTTVPVDTTTSCFVRVTALSSTNVVVALSNPVGLLREAPPLPISPERLAPDTTTP